MNKLQFEALFDIIVHGKYSFYEFMNCDIESEVSVIEVKSRLIYVPTEKLKTFHHFLNMVICEQLKFNKNVVFSYRKGTSTLDAIEAHKDNKYFFQTDIKSFYSSINKDLIKRTILNSFDNIPVLEFEKYLDVVLKYFSFDDVLPTGFSVSPIISNSILFEFDNEFENYCNENNIVYTRYSDDIIVSSMNEIDESISFVISDFLNKFYDKKLCLNKSKSRFSHKGRKVKILGMVILPNGEVTIDNKKKKEIEILLHFYREDREKFKDIVGHDLDKAMARISGILNYIKVADEKYLNKLMRRYGVTVIDSFVHKAL